MLKPRLVIVTVASVALSSVAVADGYEPVSKGFAAPPAVSWTGFYIGAQVGAGNNEGEATFCDNTCFETIEHVSVDNVLAGGYIGYNYQMGKYVIGIEGDINATFGDDNWTGDDVPAIPFGYVIEQEFYASIRARAGFLAAHNLLVFGTGGVAFADYKMSNPGCPPCGFGGTTTFIDDNFYGWVIGGGFEYAMGNRIHMKGEYLHSEFDDETRRVGGAPRRVIQDLQRNDQFRIGVSFKIGGN